MDTVSSVLSRILLFTISKRRGSNFASKFIRKIVEHKRFRSLVGICLVVTVALIAGLPIGSQAQAFSENDFKANVFVTDEVALTTRKTSRLPVVGPLSQGFTYYHPGVDIENGFDEPIYPLLTGVVAETGFQTGGYGNYVLLDHQNGYFSLYAHLNKILIVKDQEVSQETTLGTVGVTGRSTGSHLHFEIYENDIAVNPLTILPELPLGTPSANLYIGGPTSLPSRPLILPISQQAPFDQQPVTSGAAEKNEKPAKPSLGIWLPDGLVNEGPKQASDLGDSVKSRQLPKLPQF